jgi:hypothetical protein
LAGDFHLAAMGRLTVAGPGATQVEILVGPGAQTGNPLALLLQPPQFDWFSLENKLHPHLGRPRHHHGEDRVLRGRRSHDH